MDSTMTSVPNDDAHAGDVIEAQGVPGAPSRRGVITEVIGAGVHRHYRVRWDEQHETLFFPGPSGAIVLRRRDG